MGLPADSLIRALINSAPVAIYHADSAGRMTWGNPQYRAIFQLAPDQSLDDWAQALHPDDAPRIEALWENFFRTGLRSTRFEYAARAITGEWRHLSEHVVAIDAEHDRGFVGTITDVSDLKRAHAQLEKLHHAAEAANRAKSEFLAIENCVNE